jgi:hypothetical protein
MNKTDVIPVDAFDDEPRPCPNATPLIRPADRPGPNRAMLQGSSDPISKPGQQPKTNKAPEMEPGKKETHPVP